MPDLTPRQLDVVRLVATGRANKQIAFALCLSETTVKGYVSVALQAFGRHTRTEVALHYLANCPEVERNLILGGFFVPCDAARLCDASVRPDTQARGASA